MSRGSVPNVDHRKVHLGEEHRVPLKESLDDLDAGALGVVENGPEHHHGVQDTKLKLLLICKEETRKIYLKILKLIKVQSSRHVYGPKFCDNKLKQHPLSKYQI